MHERVFTAPLEMPGSSRVSPQVPAAVLLALCLLLCLKPYYGIHHDSFLYLAQALLRWKPGQFGQDLFFAYGSQAGFTAFPPMAGWLLRHFSAGEIFMAITLAGRLALSRSSIRCWPSGSGVMRSPAFTPRRAAD